MLLLHIQELNLEIVSSVGPNMLFYHISKFGYTKHNGWGILSSHIRYDDIDILETLYWCTWFTDTT